MLVVVLRELVLGVWLFGVVAVLLLSISGLVFSLREEKAGPVIGLFFKRIVLAPFWPLALLSEDGREAVRRLYNHF